MPGIDAGAVMGTVDTATMAGDVESSGGTDGTVAADGTSLPGDLAGAPSDAAASVPDAPAAMTDVSQTPPVDAAPAVSIDVTPAVPDLATSDDAPIPPSDTEPDPALPPSDAVAFDGAAGANDAAPDLEAEADAPDPDTAPLDSALVGADTGLDLGAIPDVPFGVDAPPGFVDGASDEPPATDDDATDLATGDEPDLGADTSPDTGPDADASVDASPADLPVDWPYSPADPSRYHFEGTTQGFIDVRTGGSLTSSSPDRAFAGAYSLAADLDIPAAPYERFIGVKTALGAALPAGTQVTFRFWLPAGFPTSSVQVYFTMTTATGMRSAGYSLGAAQVQLGQWQTPKHTVPADSLGVVELGVRFIATGPWSGRVYLDAIDW
jgi:hypothetical protein